MYQEESLRTQFIFGYFLRTIFIALVRGEVTSLRTLAMNTLCENQAPRVSPNQLDSRRQYKHSSRNRHPSRELQACRGTPLTLGDLLIAELEQVETYMAAN